MRTSAKYRHLPGWCQAKFRMMQHLAGHTAATLKGCGYALQQNLDKATKTKPKTVQKMFWTEILIPMGLPDDLPRQVLKNILDLGFGSQISTLDIQYFNSKSWILIGKRKPKQKKKNKDLGPHGRLSTKNQKNKTKKEQKKQNQKEQRFGTLGARAHGNVF